MLTLANNEGAKVSLKHSQHYMLTNLHPSIVSEKINDWASCSHASPVCVLLDNDSITKHIEKAGSSPDGLY